MINKLLMLWLNVVLSFVHLSIKKGNTFGLENY